MLFWNWVQPRAPRTHVVKPKGTPVLNSVCRYARLYGCMLRISLIREMMFRGNFLIRLVTHVIWLVMMLMFLKVVFLHTARIGDWDEPRLLFFMSTYITLNAIINCLFMSGCGRFSELVCSGSLDFELLKPVDEQFLLTCNRIDWALVPQVVLGIMLAEMASIEGDFAWTRPHVAGYFVLVVAAVTILYSLLVALSSFSFWAVRSQELYELWFYLLQFGNYPDEIYARTVVGKGIRVALTDV